MASSSEILYQKVGNYGSSTLSYLCVRTYSNTNILSLPVLLERLPLHTHGIGVMQNLLKFAIVTSDMLLNHYIAKCDVIACLICGVSKTQSWVLHTTHM